MPVRYTQRDFDYFFTKYQRRLYRQLLQYETLHDHLPQVIQSEAQNIRELLNLPHEVISNIELKDHAEKSCLIGLKAEFELFFYVFCLYVVNKILSDAEKEGMLAEQHQGILRCVDSARSYYEEFVKGGFRNPKKLFIDKAMPQHGLDRMVRFLSSCGLEIQPLLQKAECDRLNSRFAEKAGCQLRPFSQIRTAFQVRHSIEHSFSKVGDSFLQKIGRDWQYSTWHRQFAKENGLDIGARILVDSVDIYATGAAMNIIANALRSAWHTFEKEGNLEALVS